MDYAPKMGNQLILFLFLFLPYVNIFIGVMLSLVVTHSQWTTMCNYGTVPVPLKEFSSQWCVSPSYFIKRDLVFLLMKGCETTAFAVNPFSKGPTANRMSIFFPRAAKEENDSDFTSLVLSTRS